MKTKKKFSIDINTARQLEDTRVSNGWSWKQMYAYYFGLGIEHADSVDPLDADALRKQVERKKDRDPKKDRVQHDEIASAVLNPSSPTDKTISYDVEDDEIYSATGTVYLKDGYDNITDAKLLVSALFAEFNLDENTYELVKYTPTYVNGKFKVWAKFARKKPDVYARERVIERYKKILESIGSIKPYTVLDTNDSNVVVFNMADLHWDKMPYIGYSGNYLADYEQEIYDAMAKLMERAKYTPASRAVLTLGHDFFQVNDSKGGTKKGTPVSHIQSYPDMFDTGVRILANVIHMVSRRYVTDCVYILANHDQDSSWHASRELRLMFKDVAHVNVIVDKLPFHYVEWGSTLIELTHENLKGGRGATNMPVTAREAWGRTKYHYSLGGHLHGEFTTKESRGVVVMGSRSLSDSDEWHYIHGFITNIRGMQAYVFNKDEGHIGTFNVNL